MFKRKPKPKLKEGFDVGKANMETPDYEIKIDGVVPIDYAAAINDRQKRVKKIKDDFSKKDKLTDEFIEEQDNKRMNESFEGRNLYSVAWNLSEQLDELVAEFGKMENIEDFLREKHFRTLNDAIEILQDFAVHYSYVMENEDVFENFNEGKTKMKLHKYLKEDIISDLKSDGFEVYSIDEVDPETRTEMKIDGATIAVHLPERARTWYFKNEGSLETYFSNGGKLDVNKPGLVEALPAIATAAITAAAAGAGSRLVDKVFGESTSSTEEIEIHLMDLLEDEVSAGVINYFIDNDGYDFVLVYNNNLDNIRKEAVYLSYVLSENGYKVKDWDINGKNVIILKFETPFVPEKIEESDEQEKKKRVRSANVKKKDKLYSEDDVFVQVYDDLSSEVENEGRGKEVNKQVDVPRGKRYIGPYVGPGDYDLTVYARTRDDLKWAEKIADHYGVKIDIKEDRNKTTNSYYPWKAILRNIR